jgi:hypothetical protein
MSLSNKLNNVTGLIRPSYLDIVCLVILLGLNPIAYSLFLSPGLFFPDSLSYATMARNFFSTGLLYLPTWGHIDNALILPPLFPFMIACGRCFFQETLSVAEFASSISMLILTILIFFYIKKMTDRLIAIIAIIVIQINYYFFFIGMMPLSESVFLLTIGLTLWVTLLYLNNPLKKQKMLSFLIGISCSLVFLSRQIGIIIYVFISIVFMQEFFKISGNDRRILFNNFLFIICGALILLIPYTISLYLQTGQNPLTQGFKKNEYVIKVADPEILNEIDKEKKLPTELLELIGTQQDKDYGIVYAERRRMRKLLPDASEMYGYASVANDSKIDKKVELVFDSFKKPGAYFVRLFNNIFHLKSVLGGFTTIFFFLLCFLSLIINMDKNRDFKRFLLPSFIIFYLLVVSLLTDKISRYIYILFPFCIMYISIESCKYLNWTRDILKIKLSGRLILVLIFVIVLLTMPRFFTDLDLHPKYEGLENEYGHDFKKIVNGEPVFSLFAYEAYIIGSPYRILPNDSLEKVAAYGKKTGVRWILIYHGQGSVSELQLYNNLDWYSNRLLEKTYPHIVKFRLGTKIDMALYEIL